MIGSPDEYTITIQTQRGLKEFSFDQVFTPDHSQEKVFEDTSVSLLVLFTIEHCIVAVGLVTIGSLATIFSPFQQISHTKEDLCWKEKLQDSAAGDITSLWPEKAQ